MNTASSDGDGDIVEQRLVQLRHHLPHGRDFERV
jgi:hypothetical protein